MKLDLHVKATQTTLVSRDGWIDEWVDTWIDTWYMDDGWMDKFRWKDFCYFAKKKK